MNGCVVIGRLINIVKFTSDYNFKYNIKVKLPQTIMFIFKKILKGGNACENEAE